MTVQHLSLRRHRVRAAAQTHGWSAHENPHTGQWMLVTPHGSRPVDPTHRWGDYPLSLAELEQLLGVDPDMPAVTNWSTNRKVKS